MTATSLYGPSTASRRRRTNAELGEVDDAIIAAVEADWPVTLRGVYYRVVSAGAVDKTEKGYRLVGRQLLKLRRAGLIPYSRITDGTRWIRKPRTWSSIDAMLEDASASYRRALWHDADDEVMIFTEKDAISGVIFPITERWDVPLGVLRGYSSESFAHSTAASIVDSNRSRGGSTYVYQLGDHDPSGVGAWADFVAKVRGFITEIDNTIADFVVFERLAVTPEQIELLDLPTRPTKRTDPRAHGFEGGSVEVDAIPAPELRGIVNDAITALIDSTHLGVHLAAEEGEREMLRRIVEREFMNRGDR